MPGLLHCWHHFMLFCFAHAFVFWVRFTVQCHQHTPLVLFPLHDLDAFAEEFEQVIISVISFSAMFANWIKICSMSAARTIGVILWCVG